jgi:hypothetical protein
MKQPIQVTQQMTEAFVRLSGCKALVGSLRVFLRVCIGVVAFGGGAVGSAVYASESPVPPFVFESVYASNYGSIYGVSESRHADLVLINGGFDSGFRIGMICRVANGTQEIGEIMLVDVRNHCAAAIIVKLEVGQVISPTDSVRIKTVKF